MVVVVVVVVVVEMMTLLWCYTARPPVVEYCDIPSCREWVDVWWWW